MDVDLAELVALTGVGVDAGSTLCKIVVCSAGSAPRYERMPSNDLGAVAYWIDAVTPKSSIVGLTGGGGGRLSALLGRRYTFVDEFESWRIGLQSMRAARDAADKPFLGASLGTGTLIFKIHSARVQRVASTTMGGGTLVGLGRILAGASKFDELAQLAAQGDPAHVDLRIADVYPTGEINIPGGVPAVAFGRVADPNASYHASDLAAGLMRMVGEQVGLLLASVAAEQQCQTVLIGGSVVASQNVLRRTLRTILLARGLHAVFVDHGPHIAAIGALLACARNLEGPGESNAHR